MGAVSPMWECNPVHTPVPRPSMCIFVPGSRKMLLNPEEKILFFVWSKTHGVESSLMRKLPLTSNGKSTFIQNNSLES